MREGSTRIGLEVHCQLTSLKTKLFCGCSADYRGDEPNTHICPICMGLPGTLPMLNNRAIEESVKIALALGSKVSGRTSFYRKNYYYPDMPKNFQISQYDKAGGVPLAIGGSVSVGGGEKVRIRRLQLEEDPGKLVYEGTIASSTYTLVDYNRAGIALTEIVTEPDLRNPKQARIFLQKLRSVLEHLSVCVGGLEGAMRCDANVSIEGGKRVEVKNISSFKEVERALSFEITRQKALLGRRVERGMETRHWDDVRRVTVSLRVKEEEEDYRYFPEPDLLPVIISDEALKMIESHMPELPDSRRQRFIHEFGLSKFDAEVITMDKAWADYFEECVKYNRNPVRISHWIVSDILGYLHRTDQEIGQLKIMPKDVTELVEMVDTGVVSEKTAKSVLLEALHTGRTPRLIITEKRLEMLSEKDDISQIVKSIFKANPQTVKDAIGNPKAINFLMGLVMKTTKGRADPDITRKIIENEISKSKKDH